jgi:hypothetical protein
MEFMLFVLIHENDRHCVLSLVSRLDSISYCLSKGEMHDNAHSLLLNSLIRYLEFLVEKRIRTMRIRTMITNKSCICLHSNGVDEWFCLLVPLSRGHSKDL